MPDPERLSAEHTALELRMDEIGRMLRDTVLMSWNEERALLDEAVANSNRRREIGVELAAMADPLHVRTAAEAMSEAA